MQQWFHYGKSTLLLELFKQYFLGQQTTVMKLLTTHLLHDKYIGNFTLNNAITTEKKLINAVAKITGLEKTAGLLNT